MQEIIYSDPAKRDQVLQELQLLPPLVAIEEIESLKSALAEAGEGKRFILQGGDCVELFADCTHEAITNKLKIILQMSLILTYAVRRPVIRIGRIAGQYFKPRSNPMEIVNGISMHAYRGDGINGFAANPKDRTPDPERLRLSYFYAASTLNHIRAITKSGFTDLHHPKNWDLAGFQDSPIGKRYNSIVNKISDAVDFFDSINVFNDIMKSVDYFTSHEGLHLDYEQGLTRTDPKTGKLYNVSAHMLWIGERTRQLDGPHVQYFATIENPIGIKISNKIAPDDLIALLDTLNPNRTRGRITLITRMGDQIEALPNLIKVAQKSNHPVTWSSDPMHGNTIVTEDNIKTRHFEAVRHELFQTYITHRKHNSRLNGIHFELTGENVTECLGGISGFHSEDLKLNYQSYCDPRLNYSQSLEIAFLIARLLRR